METERADVHGVDEHLRADVEASLLKGISSCEHHAARAASRFRYRHEAVGLDDGATSCKDISAIMRDTVYGVKNWPILAFRTSICDATLPRKSQPPDSMARLDGLPRDRQQIGEGADGVLVAVRADDLHVAGFKLVAALLRRSELCMRSRTFRRIRGTGRSCSFRAE